MASHSLSISTAIALLLALSGCTAATSNSSAAKDSSGLREKPINRLAEPVSAQVPPSPSAPTSGGTNPQGSSNEDLTQNPVADGSLNVPSVAPAPDSSASFPPSSFPANPSRQFSSSSPYAQGGDRPSAQQQDPRMALALHLTNIGTKIYTTGWCPSCKRQEREFGEVAFAQIPKINCEQQPDVCADAGVHRYPTWEINGQKYERGFPLEELAQLSNFSGPMTSARRY